jgi:hypothetical protein
MIAIYVSQSSERGSVVRPDEAEDAKQSILRDKPSKFPDTSPYTHSFVSKICVWVVLFCDTFGYAEEVCNGYVSLNALRLIYTCAKADSNVFRAYTSSETSKIPTIYRTSQAAHDVLLIPAVSPPSQRIALRPHHLAHPADFVLVLLFRRPARKSRAQTSRQGPSSRNLKRPLSPRRTADTGRNRLTELRLKLSEHERREHDMGLQRMVDKS